MNFEGGKKNDHRARRLAKDVRVEDAKLCVSAMTPEEVGEEESRQKEKK